MKTDIESGYDEASESETLLHASSVNENLRKQSSLNNNRTSMFLIIALVLFVLVVILLCYLFGFVWFVHSTTFPTEQSFDLSATNKVVNGVSGSLFSGEKTTIYNGKRMFDRLTQTDLNRKLLVTGFNSKYKLKCEKWGVLTTIHDVSDVILQFRDQLNWCLIIIGDLKSPKPYPVDSDRMIFLSADQQNFLVETLGLYADFVKLLPWNHFGRKNIGYLFAIEHGAKWVWDFDDDNILKQPLNDVIEKDSSSSLLLTNSKCVAYNPYIAMGHPTAWPRGYPLQLIQDSNCDPRKAILSPSSSLWQRNVSVFQSLADHDPDVDAIYRLTQRIPFNFTPGLTTIIIPARTFVPYNAQATLFSYDSLWSLLLPVSVHGRVSDIWRSYFSQRLLWDVSSQISFTSPKVNQYRNSHNYLADFDAETDLYMKSGQLVTFLMYWSSNKPTVPGRIEDLMIEAYERSYIGLQDIELYQCWLKGLIRVGYHFPFVQ
jgi:hypothetical protein